MQETTINFIGIGAQKAGTTWLFYQLKQLPDFSFPVLKELHYFSRSPEYPCSNFLAEPLLANRLLNDEWAQKALDKIRSKEKNSRKAKWYTKWFFSDYNDEWYLSLFDLPTPFKGEISPSYALLEPKDIEKMYQVAPGAKIIFMLRNPVDRAWSQYRFYTLFKKNFDFSKVKMEDIIRFIDSDTQELRSDYLRTLDNYLQVYPKEQIMLCFYDALADQPLSLMEEIVGFIGGRTGDIAKYCSLQKKVDASPPFQQPPQIRDYLKEKYRSQIEGLADRYGAYCEKWRSDLYEIKKAESRILPPVAVK